MCLIIAASLSATLGEFYTKFLIRAHLYKHIFSASVHHFFNNNLTNEQKCILL